MTFPKLKMILAHMGHPWTTDCIVTIRKHPNLFADISGLFYRPLGYYNALRTATEWNVLHKLLFGSDFPIATPQETMDALQTVNDILDGTKLPRVPEQPLRDLIHRDSLDLLGIDA
jgi:predicted TIM-barrel fold metal-dependent hydrolase